MIIILTNNYTIKQDQNKNDVLVKNNQLIPLNKAYTSIEYQQKIADYCHDNMEYQAYQVNSECFIVKEMNDKEYSVKVITNQITELDSGLIDDYTRHNIAFNNYYIVSYEQEYVCPIVEVLAAYDIKNKKLIDIKDNRTKIELADSVINYKRCLYDVIASILTKQILMIDKDRLFRFLSFIVNYKIDETNYQSILDIAKYYLYACYPMLKQLNISTDYKDILNMNELYGVDYFRFHKIPYEIDGIGYLHNKQYVKK